eukprot:TRINITY_DN6708_c0_g1_i1.p1 TRINITY_DN6708_c0_g1~~TRINITY_DN6708_c0_g1_i1.p1  ORF type:complete len:314 (-),score=158.08 TRINITY_DN6708_c0_g1_i1:63-1004(-)
MALVKNSPDKPIEEMIVKELKEELLQRNLSTVGLKAVLYQRLKDAIDNESSNASMDESKDEVTAVTKEKKKEEQLSEVSDKQSTEKESSIEPKKEEEKENDASNEKTKEVKSEEEFEEEALNEKREEERIRSENEVKEQKEVELKAQLNEQNHETKMEDSIVSEQTDLISMDESKEGEINHMNESMEEKVNKDVEMKEEEVEKEESETEAIRREIFDSDEDEVIDPEFTKTRNELKKHQLPKVVPINIPSDATIQKIGEVSHSHESTLIVKADKNGKTMDLDSVLCLSDHQFVGRIDDVFGPVWGGNAGRRIL